MKQLLTKIWLICLSVLICLLWGSVVSAELNKININTATKEELVLLKRIGQSYAKRIIAYREQSGGFLLPEDIMKVKGIGLKTFEENKDIIVVEDEDPAIVAVEDEDPAIVAVKDEESEQPDQE